ncbi:MAG: hypothetical protein QOD63_1976, partial [Actinomycetota bacterium]|nr:hypothetical protein [Actinomycetota bacterium]
MTDARQSGSPAPPEPVEGSGPFLSTGPGIFDRNRLLWVEWTNVGFATAQILEAEGVGPGAPGVGFDLNKSLSHDAGLRARRR